MDDKQGDDAADKQGVEMNSVETGGEGGAEMTAEEKKDKVAQDKWLAPSEEVLWKKLVLLFVVFFCLWVFLLTLSIMGTGFKLLGGPCAAQLTGSGAPPPLPGQRHTPAV